MFNIILLRKQRFMVYKQGAVGLAIWVPSVVNQPKDTETSDTKISKRGYSSLSPHEEKGEAIRSRPDGRNAVELSILEHAVDSETDDEYTVLDDMKVCATVELF